MAKSLPLVKGALVQMDQIGIGASLDQFETLFEDLDVKTESLTSAMDGITGSSMDVKDVNVSL